MISAYYMARDDQGETPRKKPVTVELIEGVLGWLSQPEQRELGRDQRWLAEAVGMDEGQLSRTLRGEYRTSKHVDKLIEVTGVHYDVVEGVDPEGEEMLRMFAALDERERAVLKRLLEKPALLHNLQSIIDSLK